MPLFKGRFVTQVKPLGNVDPNETIYTIPHTREQFRSKEYPLATLFYVLKSKMAAPMNLTFSFVKFCLPCIFSATRHFNSVL